MTSSPTVASPATVAPARPGIRFDAESLRVGTRVGALMADSVALVRAAGDMGLVGVVRFQGELELDGRLTAHFDADARDRSTCFEADSASAGRMPRWSGDERRPWLCFDDHAAAQRLIGTPHADSALRVVIDRFTIHRGFSDQVNSARLVRVRP